MATIKEKLAPQGSVIPPVARDTGGVPIVFPGSGYDGHYPVQFDNEADEDFLGRVAQFESSYANAVKNEPGQAGVEAAKSALKARYEADLLALDREFKVTEPAPKKAKKVVEEDEE